MEHSSFLPIVAAAIIICMAFFRVRRVRLPPGPLGLPVVGYLPFLDSNLHSSFAGLAAVYGPIFSLRLGTKQIIVISSPSLAREILRNQDHTFANHVVTVAARTISYNCSSIAFLDGGPTWRLLRRITAREMLGPIGLDAHCHLRRRKLRRVIRRLHSAAIAGEAVSIQVEVFLVMADIMTSMLWGATSEGDGLVKEFLKLVEDMVGVLGLPNVSDYFPALARFDLQGVERKMRVLVEQYDRIFSRIIEMKKSMVHQTYNSGKEGKTDFLNELLKLEKNSNDSSSLTMDNVKALLVEMIVGSTETTSTVVEFAMTEMIKKPNILKRVQDELDKVVGKDMVVEESHLQKLNYLSIVIKEVLRLHPALPLLVPHCPSSMCTVGGYIVPKGSFVFINAWAIQRDANIWKDPLTFKPERFMDMEGSKYDYFGNDLAYVPFGSGRRICVGASLAERMITYSLASFVHSFDWRLPEGTKLDNLEKYGIVLKKVTPLIAMPIPRLSNSELYS